MFIQLSSHFKTWEGSRSAHHSDRSDDLRWAIWMDFKAQRSFTQRHKDGWCLFCKCSLGLTNSPQHNNKTESKNKTFQVPSCFLGFGWHTPALHATCFWFSWRPLTVGDVCRCIWLKQLPRRRCNGVSTGFAFGASDDVLKIMKLQVDDWWEERVFSPWIGAEFFWSCILDKSGQAALKEDAIKAACEAWWCQEDGWQRWKVQHLGRLPTFHRELHCRVYSVQI